MSGTSREGGSKEQEEIARLKKEKEQMAEKLRILELEKEGIKVRTLSMFDGQKIAKSVRNRGSVPGFQPVVDGNMVEENPRMKMYKAQAKEKEMEIDKMKEEMERLKREKEEIFQLVKRLGNDQRVTATSELASRNMELDVLTERDKEKKAEMDEMKKKNEELEERLRRLELNKEGRSDAPCSSSCKDVRDTGRRAFEKSEPPHYNARERIVESQKNTILVNGWARGKRICWLVLSADRNKWIETDFKIPDTSWFGGAVYLDEKLYLISGFPNHKSLYKLDKTLKWEQLGGMNIGRRFIKNGCLEWNGYMWVIGGRNDKYENLSSVERYDLKKNKWTMMKTMKYPRSNAAAATWNNGIVISGGSKDSTGAGSTVEFFSPENGSWTELPHMPTALAGHSLVSYKNKLIVMGGTDGKTLNSVWQLDPHEANPKWTKLPSMKHSSECFGGIVFDEEIYAIGGVRLLSSEFLDRVEIFDGKEWRDGPFLPYPMAATSAMIIPQHFADRLCNYKPE